MQSIPTWSFERAQSLGVGSITRIGLMAQRNSLYALQASEQSPPFASPSGKHRHGACGEGCIGKRDKGILMPYGDAAHEGNIGR